MVRPLVALAALLFAAMALFLSRKDWSGFHCLLRWVRSSRDASSTVMMAALALFPLGMYLFTRDMLDKQRRRGRGVAGGAGYRHARGFKSYSIDGDLEESEEGSGEGGTYSVSSAATGGAQGRGGGGLPRLFQRLARKIGSKGRQVLSLGVRLGGGGGVAGSWRSTTDDPSESAMEVPWQRSGHRVSFGRSDRASRASSESEGFLASEIFAPSTSTKRGGASSAEPRQQQFRRSRTSSLSGTPNGRRPAMARIVSGQDLTELDDYMRGGDLSSESNRGGGRATSVASSSSLTSNRHGGLKSRHHSNGHYRNRRHHQKVEGKGRGEGGEGGGGRGGGVEEEAHGSMQASETFVYNGHLAVDCLAYDTTEPLMDEVKQIVTDQHLLQFGVMLGESSAELALGLQGAPPPVSNLNPHGSKPTPFSTSSTIGNGSLFGVTDCPGQFSRGWERIVEEHKEGLHYWVCRKHLRKGLYMYKSRTVYEKGTTADMVAFTFADNEIRKKWDDSSVALEPILPPSMKVSPPSKEGGSSGSKQASKAGEGGGDGGGGEPLDPSDEGIRRAAAPCSTELRRAAFAQSSFMYSRTRFPPPMAQREYVFARRVWYKSDDGGCYCVSRTCPPHLQPTTPNPGCRTVRVADFSAGFVIRAVPGIYYHEGAVEVTTNYFEDSCANSGIINMAIRKTLWPMIQKSELGFRRFQQAMMMMASGGGGDVMPPPRRLPPFPSSSGCLTRRLDSRLDEREKDEREAAVESEPPAVLLERGSSKTLVSAPSVNHFLLAPEEPEEGGDGRNLLDGQQEGGEILNHLGLADVHVTISGVVIPLSGSTADLSLANAGMWSGYCPALTSRLQLTPILYAGYVTVWRAGVYGMGLFRRWRLLVASFALWCLIRALELFRDRAVLPLLHGLESTREAAQAAEVSVVGLAGVEGRPGRGLNDQAFARDAAATRAGRKARSSGSGGGGSGGGKKGQGGVSGGGGGGLMRRLAKIATVAGRAAAIQGLAMLAGRLPPSPGSSTHDTLLPHSSTHDKRVGNGGNHTQNHATQTTTTTTPPFPPSPVVRFTRTKTFLKLLFGQEVLDENGRETPLYVW